VIHARKIYNGDPPLFAHTGSEYSFAKNKQLFKPENQSSGAAVKEEELVISVKKFSCGSLDFVRHVLGS